MLFVGPLVELDTAKERIGELEDRATVTQTEILRKKERNKQNNRTEI